jgi:hypothetical protein
MKTLKHYHEHHKIQLVKQFGDGSYHQQLQQGFKIASHRS